ncbi:hypothetical protein [Halioxenophilus sp. WMMB6]|uniref:hypothetical protein n=1 Tax=Halioxenophilus sp. WMMB6 TaxID=3073815 RepID=UPI00295E9839|nr:hypothetical protein [Halioxenophilus sp. WMMB6]
MNFGPPGIAPKQLSFRLNFIVTHLVVVIITAACLMMALVMREGLPGANTLAERLFYIGNHTTVWLLGWLLWMSSALGLLLFAFFLAEHLAPSLWRNLGLTLVALGIVPDLTAEVIYAFIIPNVLHSAATSELRVLERLAIFLTGFLGNGLYNLGGLLLTLLLWRKRDVGRGLLLMGLAGWLLGLALSVAIALQALLLAQLLTAVAMGVSTLWMLLVAYRVFARC